MKIKYMQTKYSFTVLLLLFVIAGCSEKKEEAIEVSRAQVYTTAKDTDLKITKSGEFNFKASKQPLETQVFVLVDPKQQFQKFIGVGGAITDASAETFAKLPANKQQELITAYFDTEKGIGYTIGRTNINSCDFSSSSYTYVKDNDTTLSSFDIKHDQTFKIPMIKKAFQAANNLKFYP